ncbi:MAG: serine/threonine protein kinase [Paraglaciecola sp.]|jgi:serine/threonine protein kinase
MTIPKNIGKYVIECVLGSGAMGIVYQARDTKIERTVAIKILHPYLRDGESGEDLELRFLQEAKAAARCQHPNIVTIYDFGSDSSPYIVMEKVVGIELKAHIKSASVISFGTAIDITGQVLAALGHAHDKGIIHRDIKPANIILLENGQVKVSDFGVARLDTSDLTSTGFMVGTPNYMSPEGLQGMPVDLRGDLYSVGVVLFELISGVRYNRKIKREENLQKLDQLTHLTQENIRSIQPVLSKALQSDPDERYLTATEFSAQLSYIAEPGGVQSSPIVIPTEISKPSVPEEPWDVSVLSKLEQSLAPYLGPMAKFLVRKNSRCTTNVAQLVENLSLQIVNEDERSQFVNLLEKSGITSLAEVTSSGERSHTPVESFNSCEGTIPPEVRQQLTQMLAFHLGPLASRVIKKMSKQHATLESLINGLSKHVPDSLERQKFIVQANKLL